MFFSKRFWHCRLQKEVSAPKLRKLRFFGLEENSDKIRGKYINFVQNLSESNFGGKQLLQQLETKPGFSLWWMSLIAEKSLYKSESITDCLKLIALEEILKVTKSGSIKVIGVVNPNVVNAINMMCKDTVYSIDLNNNLLHSKSDHLLLNRFYNVLPYVTRGGLWLLIYLIK